MFDEVFNYFEQLLAESLTPQWVDIVQEEWHRDGYVKLSGKVNTSGKRRGLCWSGLTARKRRFLLTVVSEDTAESHHRYMPTILRKAKAMVCKQFIMRVMQMNTYTAYLPCLKQVKGSPDEMEFQNVPFSELNMCIHILSAMPQLIAGAYWSIKGRSFPTDVEKLKDDLMLIEAQQNRTDSMLKNMQGVYPSGGAWKSAHKEGNISARRTSASSPSAIPRTSKPGASPKVQEDWHCELCKKYSKSTMGTNNTDILCKWHPGGMPKCAKKSSKPSRQHRSQQCELGTIEVQFAQLKC